VNGDFDEKIRELCLGFYRDLDQRIERLVAAAGPETNILMTSDHGFGATTEVVYINEWLAQNGYLRWTDQAESDAGTKLTLDKIKDHTTNIDWANTMAYAVTPSSNAIYIRRSSGGGKGVSDADYPAYCRELRDKLLAWENPADGGKVFTDVFFNEPKLAGSDSVAEYAPDLTLRLRDGGFVSIVRSGGEIVRPRLKVDGTHRPNGIFVANGPNIRVGEQIQPLDIVDIAPMLLYGIGLPVPEDLEGRVPEEVFTPETFKQFPVQRGKATISGDVASENEPEVSDEEKEALMAQMKVLGYMD
jgi:predicted AlkP superfamily phosphohydrolase/phosphomutase